MFYLFFSMMSLIFKWQRLIFILISLEFLVMTLFLNYSVLLFSMMYFYFMSFTVISSVLGMVMMVGSLKHYGQDKSVFYGVKLNFKLLVFKTKNIFRMLIFCFIYFKF